MSGTLLLARSDVGRLLSLADCTGAVEAAFAAYAGGRTVPPVVAGLHVEGGGFHLKAAALDTGRFCFAAKLNANFPDNPARFGLPTIRGLILLSDARDGRPLAVLESGSITALRTAAATAVAARYLARPDAAVATVIGCGTQGPMQLRALALVRPLSRAWLFDRVPARAESLATQLSAELGIPVRAGTDLRRALADSLLCVTCTPAREPVLGPGDVGPGTFVAAVGADNEEKVEIAPALLAACRVVPDLTAQASRIGDLHHALAGGAMRVDQVHGELPEIIAGLRPGRTSDDQIFVFDSTGTALQDVAAAALVYERALAAGEGTPFDFDL